MRGRHGPVSAVLPESSSATLLGTGPDLAPLAGLRDLILRIRPGQDVRNREAFPGRIPELRLTPRTPRGAPVALLREDPVTP
ncbi:hypothetical protein GCM10007079_28070 [Nocardiopsis terrae]|nr:hypothetical protein GCM10007079_28070 [Nocardiopsis terrae]